MIAALEQKGVSKYWLARQLEIEPKTIYRILSEGHGFTTTMADKMLKILKLEVRSRR